MALGEDQRLYYYYYYLTYSPAARQSPSIRGSSIALGIEKVEQEEPRCHPINFRLPDDNHMCVESVSNPPALDTGSSNKYWQ